MRRTFAIVAAAATVAGAFFASASPSQSAAPSATAAPDDIIKRGEYLMRAGDCVACHTAPGGKPFAGGSYMPTPFGDLSVPNITPDKATGIGNWSDDQFYRALHEGVDAKGQYLYPVFPFPWYTNVTRDDALAIKAYLFSLPPENAPRKPIKIHFPFDIREALLTWRTLFFKVGDFKHDPSRSDKIERGAYLVEGLGHCGECHNSHNVLGASEWSGKLEGGEIDGWYAPNITSDGKGGIGGWTEDQLATFLKTGAAPGKGVVLGPMRETIDDSLRYLSDDDLHAMAAYLKDTAAKQTTSANTGAYADKRPPGQQAYLTYCSSCHLPSGKGVEGAVPALAGNGAVLAKGPENVIRVVVGGLSASNGLAPMPAVGAGMSDKDIADVVDYVRNSWGNSAPVAAGAGDVANLRPQTHTLMSATTPAQCAPAGNSDADKAVASSAMDTLRDIKGDDLVPQIDAMLTKVKQAAPAAGRDQIVNDLTAAYCRVELTDAKLSPADRDEKVGNFGVLVYGQLTSPEKQP
jgi:mono/diheme cytochrome c family protein